MTIVRHENEIILREMQHKRLKESHDPAGAVSDAYKSHAPMSNDRIWTCTWVDSRLANPQTSSTTETEDFERRTAQDLEPGPAGPRVALGEASAPATRCMKDAHAISAQSKRAVPDKRQLSQNSSGLSAGREIRGKDSTAPRSFVNHVGASAAPRPPADASQTTAKALSATQDKSLSSNHTLGQAASGSPML